MLFLTPQPTVSKHPFNGPFLGLPRWAETRKVNQSGCYWSKREWHQLGHMLVCASLQTDNHASTPPLNSVKALKAKTALSSSPQHIQREWSVLCMTGLMTTRHSRRVVLILWTKSATTEICILTELSSTKLETTSAVQKWPFRLAPVKPLTWIVLEPDHEYPLIHVL